MSLHLYVWEHMSMQFPCPCASLPLSHRVSAQGLTNGEIRCTEMRSNLLRESRFLVRTYGFSYVSFSLLISCSCLVFLYTILCHGKRIRYISKTVILIKPILIDNQYLLTIYYMLLHGAFLFRWLFLF